MNLLFLLVFMILLLVVASATSDGDMLSPSIVVTAAFSTSVAFAFAMRDKWIWVTYTDQMTVILAVGVTAFVAGEMFMRLVLYRKFRPSQGVPAAPHTLLVPAQRRLLSIANWKISLITVLGAMLIAWQYLEVSRLAALGGFSGFGNMFTYYRVQVSFTLSDEGLNPLLVQGLRILEICGLIAAFVIVNNVLIWKEQLRSNLKYLLPICLFVAKNLINSDRGRVLSLVVFILVVTFYLAWQSNAWRNLGLGRFVFRVVLLSITVMAGFYYLADIVGRTSQETRTPFEYLATYFGGSIANFAQYIEQPVPPNAHFGEETFLNIYGFLNSLGLTDYRRLSQLEFRYMDPTTRGNLYTFFRGPMQDFGIGGMLLVSFVIGAAFTWYATTFIKYRGAGKSTDRAIIVYAYLFYLIATASVQNRLFFYFSVAVVTIIVGLLVMYGLLVDVDVRKTRRGDDATTTDARLGRRPAGRMLRS